MNLTDDKLKAIEELAGSFMSIKEISYVIEEDFGELEEEVENPETQAHKRFYKGYLMEKSNQRKAVLELAKGGSAPAQALAKSYMDELKAEL